MGRRAESLQLYFVCSGIVLSIVPMPRYKEVLSQLTRETVRELFYQLYATIQRSYVTVDAL